MIRPFILLVVVPSLIVSCGGGPSKSSGGGVSGKGIPASSGEYLWELGSDQNLIYATIDSASGALGAPVSTGGPAYNSVDYPSIAVTPSGDYLFALYESFGELNVFELLGPGLSAFPISSTGNTINLDLEQALAMHPSGKFLYVVMSGSSATIQPIVVNKYTLSAGTKVTEKATFGMAVIDPSGRFLYANDGSLGRIFTYLIDPSTGSLTPVANSPFTLPTGQVPTYLLIGGSASSPSLYVPLSDGRIAALSINSSNGALSPITGSPFHSDQPLYYFSVDPSGRFLYGANFQDGAVHGLVIDPNTGALSAMSGSPFSVPGVAGMLTTDPAGKFLYVRNSGNTIYGFTVDSTTGQLTPIPGSPFPSAPYPVMLTATRIS
jgi:6-phosphogluconolactonase